MFKRGQDNKIGLSALCCSLITVCVAISGPTAAQEASEPTPAALVAAFGGDWFSFDRSTGTGTTTCKVALDGSTENKMMSAKVSGCSAPLDTVSSWTIEGGQIKLRAGENGAEIASLGGNQFRITGDFASGGSSLILERAAGDGNAAKIRQAVATHKCIYKGFTDKCATQDELAPPNAASDDDLSKIQTLVNLNVRSQPRSDASVVGVIPADTQITISQCLVASDGMWCRASFGSDVGWFARNAVRQNEWPILTFTKSTS